MIQKINSFFVIVGFDKKTVGDGKTWKTVFYSYETVDELVDGPTSLSALWTLAAVSATTSSSSDSSESVVPPKRVLALCSSLRSFVSSSYDWPAAMYTWTGTRTNTPVSPVSHASTPLTVITWTGLRMTAKLRLVQIQVMIMRRNFLLVFFFFSLPSLIFEAWCNNLSIFCLFMISFLWSL